MRFATAIRPSSSTERFGLAHGALECAPPATYRLGRATAQGLFLETSSMSVRRISGLSLALALSALPASAEPLLITDVAAPAINCVFNRSCRITVTDSVGPIPIPGGSGTAILQSRTFLGMPDAPAAGLTGYEFRVDLTKALSGATKICITGLKLDTGPLSRLAYPGGIGPGYVFAISSGALGTVGVAGAESTEGEIRFAFAWPICAGDSSYFFGFASAKGPRALNAQILLDGGRSVDAPARAPGP
jgi:hypothetical protein